MGLSAWWVRAAEWATESYCHWRVTCHWTTKNPPLLTREKKTNRAKATCVTHTHTSKWEERIEKKRGRCSQRVATFCVFKGNWITAAQTREEEEAKNRGRLFRCWWTRASDQIGAHSSFYLTGRPHIISVSRHKRLQIRHFSFAIRIVGMRNEGQQFFQPFFRA